MKPTDQPTRIEKIQRFDEWMRKLRNNYYADQERMHEAFKMIE